MIEIFFRGCGIIICLLTQNIVGFDISIAMHEGDRLLRCDALQSGTNLPTFRKDTLPPSSGYKMEVVSFYLRC